MIVQDNPGDIRNFHFDCLELSRWGIETEGWPKSFLGFSKRAIEYQDSLICDG